MFQNLKLPLRPRPKPLDPIEAYSRIAPRYPLISDRRRPYLSSIENLIAARIPAGAQSLLDVGAGDGSRSLRIARAAAIPRAVLLEPSAGMRSLCEPSVTASAAIWPIRAEQLHGKEGSFDVILCLWNVLGHIFPAAARASVLSDFARLLAPGGRVFFDVNHRYNARAYGRAITGIRFLRDRFSPGGDVSIHWTAGNETCTTAGHVFTAAECADAIEKSGLIVRERLAVDYGSGQVRGSIFGGSLFYVLGHARS